MSDTVFPSHEQRPGGLMNRLRANHPSTQTSSGADSRDLLRYWNATRQDADVPLRSEIDPRGIAGMLSRTFILEQIAPGLGRFRVAGTQLHDLLGMDVRGMPMTAMLRPAAREEFGPALEKVFNTPGILRAALVSPGEFRRPKLEAELLILPLRDDLGEVTRAIGCIVSNGQIGKTPRRFDIRHMRVDPVSVVKPEARLVETRVPAVSERPIGHVPASENAALILAPPKPGQPSYLRLVVTE